MKVGVIIDAFIAFYSAGIFKFHHKKMARLLEFGPLFLISLNTKTVALIIWTPWSVVNIESLKSVCGISGSRF